MEIVIVYFFMGMKLKLEKFISEIEEEKLRFQKYKLYILFIGENVKKKIFYDENLILI